MRPSSRLAQLIALLVAVLIPLTGCASIPRHSDPEVVKRVDEDSGSSNAASLPDDLSPLALVRNFVNAAAPANDYAAVRMHLTEAARQSWQAPSELLIVEDVNTVPLPEPSGTPQGVRKVSLRVNKVGRLKADRSFVPKRGAYEAEFRVERQANGQWRIANPPPELLVSRSSFTKSYTPAPIYFLDHERNGVVPDLRYVVSQPASTLPTRIIDLLLAGPSKNFRGAMGTALPPNVDTKTNVSEAGDGALVVNFSDLGGVSEQAKQLIAAQVVLSLQGVSNARVRLQEEGTWLLPEQGALRPPDVVSYKANNSVRSDVMPLAVVNERLLELDRTADAVPGPAGSGQYEVITAGRSMDGTKLATVVRTPDGGVGMRIGPYGEALAGVDVSGSFMSRPTWRTESEVWTVVDGRRVVRMVDNGNGGWTVSTVGTEQFSGDEPITDLRLSRDGTRVAAVVGGRIMVAGVLDRGSKTTLSTPTVLSGGLQDATVTGIGWVSSDSLVAITDSSSMPVVEVTVNGLKWDPYASANLVQPVRAVTVGPDQKVVVADRSGLWQVGGQDDLWQLVPAPIGGGSIPFYPG
ncbi:sporulation and spore germination protein [Halopolyspora algeriensis]|uniref:Sporulation and spore germination protein n=1 Tax=Halopolyspora algeriensis TaxID=1500506 RepID=A0A368VDE7_9ACTN|nr:LpqB family beta-propeller domain-containing protein [Halopolyspora algeriensis]RCW39219.1 sporulation and spore germination protein [Halopolyspora algeriensis]TQM47415.1 sporulation and spore germination protein [Halopolyspora algeriensis]